MKNEPPCADEDGNSLSSANIAAFIAQQMERNEFCIARAKLVIEILNREKRLARRKFLELKITISLPSPLI